MKPDAGAELERPELQQAPVNPGSLAGRLRRSLHLRRAVLAARQARTALIDRLLNIHTIGPRTFPHATLLDDPVYYEATDYLLLRRFMRPLRLKPADIVFEIGCGMGRTVCMFARRTIRRCIGIEVDPNLADIAIENARTLRGRRASIEIRAGDAARSDYSSGTVFWINNPFGAATLNAVLDAIEDSLASRPRAIQVAYIYPFHAQAMSARPWLRLAGRLRASTFSTCHAAYWAGDGRPARVQPSDPPQPAAIAAS